MEQKSFWDCCFSCTRKITGKDEGGDDNFELDFNTSIKSPCLCCVTTREVHIDLRDKNASEEAEEAGPPPPLQKKPRREAAKRILSIWKSRRPSKQSKETSRDCEQQPAKTPPNFSREGGGVFEQTTILYGTSQGEEKAVSEKKNTCPNTKTTN